MLRTSSVLCPFLYFLKPRKSSGQEFPLLILIFFPYARLTSRNSFYKYEHLLVLYFISLSGFPLNTEASKSVGNVREVQRSRESASSVSTKNSSGTLSGRTSTCDIRLSSLLETFGFGHKSKKD